MLKETVKHIKLFIILVVSTFMMYSGVMKIVAFPGWPEQFAVWGYGKTVMYMIGALEVILSSLIFIKDTRLYGCLGLVILLTGALYTHITNVEYQEIYPAIYLMIASTVIVGLGIWEERLD